MQHETSRRDWLKAAGLAIGAGMIGGCASGSSSRPAHASLPREAGRHRPRRAPDRLPRPARARRRAQGMAMCLHHAQSQRKPDLILNTGDCVMDVLHTDRGRAQQQWDVWNAGPARTSARPAIKHCIGNHDIWGWGEGAASTTGNEPGWGKKWAMDELGLDQAVPRVRPRRVARHHARQRAADGRRRLGREARRRAVRLARDASSRRRRASRSLIGSHVPIMLARRLPRLRPHRRHAGRTRRWPSAAATWTSSASAQLFAQHPHVKLCVSGHLHQIDRAEFIAASRT